MRYLLAFLQELRKACYNNGVVEVDLPGSTPRVEKTFGDFAANVPKTSASLLTSAGN